MFPTPKGYISIPDAVDRVSRALHGEPKTIPWRGKDLDEFAELDEAVLENGRKQTMEARDWLTAELSAGRLVAQVGNFELPAEYWTCNGAHTTVHTGCLEPPEINSLDYAKVAYQPCFIERSVFEERLFQQFDTARPIKRFATSKETEEAYATRVASVREKTGRAPTFDADCAWGTEHSLLRDRVRELRANCSVRSNKDRKGGAPNLAKN